MSRLRAFRRAVVLSRTFGDARYRSQGPRRGDASRGRVTKRTVLGTRQTRGHIRVPWVAGRLRPDVDLHHGALSVWCTSSRETGSASKLGRRQGASKAERGRVLENGMGVGKGVSGRATYSLKRHLIY